VNSEPKIAAPNELPMVRKNVTPDVATPRSSKLDVFCHDQHKHLHARPDTGAEDEQVNRLQQCRCGRVHPGHQKKARAITAVPATGKILYRPVRPDQDTAADRRREHPGDHRQVRRPDVVAETPSTNCM